MTTITKEWLQKTITSIESARDEIPFGLDEDQNNMLTALKIALASLEREQIRHEHAKWSDSTFGCVGPIGPLKHLSKEALEAAAEPDDLSEWADMQFLLWDAQRRAGISDAEITAAMEDKLKINMKRQWPEPKDGEPRLHIKEPGNSPVIPGEVLSAIMKVARVRADFDDFDGDRRGIGDCLDEAEQELIVTINKYASQLAAEPIATNDVREQTAVPPVPVTPDGWISCSDRMPEMGERQYYVLAADFKNNYPPSIPNTQVGVYGDWFNDGNPTWDDGDGEDLHLKEVTHWMPLPEPPQEAK
ncbi:DUF550 domain-containing protein [Escherichia coli]|nr:DUF550 domain-containing protein [Escherichia coli]